MTLVVDRDTRETVATWNGQGWTYKSEEFQRLVETYMIEGIIEFGGEPTGDGTVILDSTVVVMPEDKGFDEAFWSQLAYDGYVVVEDEYAL